MQTVYTLGYELALANTDPTRSPQKELFERVYDRDVVKLFRASKQNGWWRIEVKDNLDRIVVPLVCEEQLPVEKTIAVCHDIERGYGHTACDPAFAETAERKVRTPH